ncbi:amino acid adenylation domain-containing protein [Heyndrickxia sporothermodurans]
MNTNINRQNINSCRTSRTVLGRRLGFIMPLNNYLMDMFDEQVKSLPNKTAIEFGQDTVSYGELNENVCLLMERLIAYSCGHQSVIGIFMDKGIEPITAMLSILKLKGTYVYLDPNLPDERLHSMIDKSKPSVIITIGNLKERLKALGILKKETICFMDIDQTNAESFATSNALVPAHGEKETDEKEIAYIYFTSGTQGIPKAVKGSYSLLHFYVEWFIRTFKVSQDDRFSQVATLSFDICIREIFVPLACGACVVIPENKDSYSAHHYLHWLDIQRVTFFSCVPSIFRLLIKDSLKSETIPALSAMKKIIIVGEVLYYSQVRQWVSVYGRKIELINFYGTTETLSKSYFLINDNMLSELEVVPIGKGIDSSQLLIIKDNRLCGIKQTGELYIRSRYITEGYLNDKEQTDRVFIQNPLHSQYKDIVYKTGDLAYYLPDGNVVLKGRSDNQIKFRGVRVELSEIEAYLLKKPKVDEAVVVLRTIDNQDELVCFITAEIPLQPDEVKKHLSGYLPAVLIPQIIIQVDSMPLNTNGKVDRNALELSKEFKEDSKFESEESWSEIHYGIHEIWCDVLELDSIGIKDNFFHTGGNSLLLMQIINRIRERYQCEIKIFDFYLNATIQGLAKHVSESLKKRPKEAFSITPVNYQTDYAASNAQSRLWMLDHIDTDGISHNMYSILKFTGDLDIPALEKAFSLLVQKHESLRTIFHMIDGEVRQLIVDPKSVQIELIDLINSDDSDIDNQIASAIKKRFDLSKFPLFFIKLYKVREKEYVCLFNIHHIIFDGWSANVLIREWTETYDSLIKGNTPRLQPLPFQYKDYSAWQRSYIEEHSEMGIYWRQKLIEYKDGLDLPTDFLRPMKRNFKGDVIYFDLGNQIHNKIKSFCLAHQVNPFIFIVSIIKLFLCKLSNQYENTSIGTPITNRDNLGLEAQIGLYVNTLVLADSFSGNSSFADILKQVHNTVAEAFENQLYPYNKLVEEMGLHRDMSRNPFFDVMVVMQNFNTQDIVLENIKVNQLPLPVFSSKFDLVFTFQGETEGLEGKIEYNTDLYKKNTVKNYLSYLKELINNVLENENRPIGEYNILPQFMKEQILQSFNNPRKNIAESANLVSIFKDKVKHFQERPALRFGHRMMTYQQLDEASDRFAAYLYKIGVRRGICVGVRMNRSFELMIAIFSILKTGGIYTPLDPALPSNRETKILEDCNCDFLVIDQGTNKPSYGITTIELTPAFLENNLTVNDFVYQQVGADDIAYIIFTSGTTGVPKGVAVEHRSIINRLKWQSDVLDMDENDIIVQKTSISFDVSIYEIFLWMFTGGSLLILPDGYEKDPAQLADEINRHKPSIIHFVPSMLQTLLLYLRNHRECLSQLSSLRCVISSGEALTKAHTNEFFSLFGDNTVQLLNLYGPTEASVDVAYYWCHKDDPAPSIPIGKPIDNNELFVLDPSGQLCPVGIPGELVISGIGVARGYVNNPIVTSEKFIRSPFTPSNSMYRTGDLARWLDTGEVEFLGRMDRQVKIRGYRIELLEIENQLMGLPYVNQAVVTCQNDKMGDSYIAVYIVTDKEFYLEDAKQELAKILPEYMIPAVWNRVAYIPVTRSGKVDPEKLENIIIHEQRQNALIMPKTHHEKIVSSVFQNVLGRSNISVSDNFFDIGGSSLKAIQAVEYFYTEYGIKLEVLTIFKYPNIRALGAHLRGSEKKDTVENTRAQNSILHGKKAISRLRKNTLHE